MELVGLGEKRFSAVSALTLADRKRLELARALATKPVLLMLDEVMEGLTPTEERDAVRKHLLSLFNVAGPDDPAVASARRQLASALF